MKIFGKEFGKKAEVSEEISRDIDAVVEANAVPEMVNSGEYGEEYTEWLKGGLSSVGMAVTEKTVLAVSAVYASVNLIAGAIASMPLPVYRRDGEERERVRHELSRFLNEQPCEGMTAAVWREYMVGSLLLKGDSFNRILRKGGMQSSGIAGFEPLNTNIVEVKKVDGRLQYVVTDNKALITKVYDQDDILHIPGPSFDGLRGKSQIKHVMRNAAGIALAADEYSAAFFKNGAKPDFAIEMPGNPTKEQQEMMRRSWDERFGGAARSHKPAIMAGGAKVHELTINAEDAQLIATRQFQVEDIARIFGVPPHLIGHTSKTTSWGTGLEQQSIAFVKYTLQRHLVKIEQELNRKCFRTQKHFVEFNTSGLERGDYKTRNEGYRIALGRAGEPGWMTVNEVRKLENLPPIDGGNEIHNGQQPATEGTGDEESATA